MGVKPWIDDPLYVVWWALTGVVHGTIFQDVIFLGNFEIAKTTTFLKSKDNHWLKK